MRDFPEPRAAVVAAALELFQAQGFDQTSVEQIAKAAGVSRSTFFRQFGGKEDVVFADHEVLLEQLREFLAEGHEDPWGAVCAASEFVYSHFAHDPELAARLRPMLDGFRALLSAVFERAIAAGQLPPESDAEALAIAFSAMLDGLGLQRIIDPEMPADRIADAAARLLD